MQKRLLQFVTLLVGVLLILSGSYLNWGITAVLAGVFFINLCIMTLLIDLSSHDTFLNPFLKGWGFTIFAIVSIFGLMVATVVAGILHKLGIIN